MNRFGIDLIISIMVMALSLATPIKLLADELETFPGIVILSFNLFACGLGLFATTILQRMIDREM